MTRGKGVQEGTIGLTGFGRHGHVVRHGARGGVFEKKNFILVLNYFFYLLLSYFYMLILKIIKNYFYVFLCKTQFEKKYLSQS